MTIRKTLLFSFLVLAALVVPTSSAQEAKIPSYLKPSVGTDTRAIRRDIPLTNAIQKAFEAGTRNFTGTPGDNYWQLETDFNIEVSLDPSTQKLSGSETILVHNNSSDELNQIYLRLDHNIFRGLVPRGGSVPAENTEGMVVTRLRVDGKEVDLHARSPQRRRGGPEPERKLSVSGLDQTLAVINLETPVPANSTVTLDIEWNTKLPGGPNGRGHRMTQRWDNELFQPTQWFPRLAKYDDLRGWDTSVYLGPAEFYNNFGRFDVKINVPGGWIVSGTGVLQNPEEVLTESARQNLTKVLATDEVTTIVGPDEIGPGQATAEGESLTWHFVADKVNDFAWLTAEKLVWTATRATIPEKGPIPVHMVYLPRNERLYEGAGPITRHALEYYSKLWAPYPFPQLTMQDGPSAGMEYPMVINSNRGAADHETAHQWWPMMVGTNETWYGWMDEGFNTYMNILSGADSRGEPADLNGRGQSYGRISGNEEEAPSMYVTNYGGNMYGFQTYNKASMMLSMLGGIVGDEALQAAMSKYTHTWAFKHPSPWDYMFFMSNELKMDLGWFWYYWLFTTESVDGSIESVSPTPNGVKVVVRQDGQMPSPVVLRVEFEEAGPLSPSMGNATMVDDKTVDITWPVDLWFAGSKTFETELTFGKRAIAKITLDPNGRFPDRDPSDNVWSK
ncbi:M1 family metallopeptidase [bacterium]|nr:M1 family metallopeptidase [bacterium]